MTSPRPAQGLPEAPAPGAVLRGFHRARAEDVLGRASFAVAAPHAGAPFPGPPGDRRPAPIGAEDRPRPCAGTAADGYGRSSPVSSNPPSDAESRAGRG
ncbi:hypothetical protein ABZ234_04580 [Nocardiopsis sp. NPDC006198]|uniref:Uncharacterized protein n=1 Tax=Streptomonospora nanhaiensis TaxID=1323731 RepID=A0ABY6YNP0_9ACTN|nr:hypothetical protein [Streptomonospora nanhaiensis]WAE73958.1 hypothetical protein OUQ99_02200 [Streptomonospora nanhaiensis]